MKVFTFSNEKLTSIAFLVLRIGIGAVMFAHGSQKVLGLFGGKGLEASTTGLSTGLGIPLFFAYLSVFTEFLGGAGLLLGALTRFFGIAMFINMLVAVLAVHLKNGLFAPTGFEYPGMMAIVALAITIAGPGLYSLDHVIFSGEGKTVPMEKLRVGSNPSFKPVTKGA